MKISEIQITPVKPRDGLVAFASFVVDGELYCGSVAIFTLPFRNGFRLVYPTKKVGETQLNLFHPINKLAGEQIERSVIKKYEEVTSNDWRRHSNPDISTV
jgi:DNA-binding cell septation regulator SpoVG